MNDRGIASVINLMVILVLSILTAVLLQRGIVENRRTEIFLDQTRAFWLAEAGMERALAELNSGGTWAGWIIQGNNAQLEDSLGTAGDYDINVVNYQSTTVFIEVTGYFPSRDDDDPVTRSIEAAATRTNTSLFNYAAFSNGALSISGQAYTDSYDSGLGVYGGANVGAEGDVGTNADMTASGLAYINGDVSTGTGGSFENSSFYSGSAAHTNNVSLPLVPVPAYLTGLSNGGSLSSTQTISPGTYQYWNITLSSKKVLTIVGPAEIYLTGDINISGQAKVYIDPASTGPVNIYFDGNVSLAGQGITNSTSAPSNLILYGTNPSSQTVTLSGQNDFYGAVYAPNSAMTLSGQGRLFGAFVGDTVSISGQGGIHYDTQLGEDGAAAAADYVVTAWRDTQTPFAVEQ